MSRELPWRDRSRCPIKVLSRLDQAQQIRMFVVQESGPMAFVVRDSSSSSDHESEGSSTARAKKYKVALGSRQTCSCPTFLTENDLCVHILWVMLKLFRVSPDNDLVVQRSILDREAAELMWKRAHQLPGPRAVPRSPGKPQSTQSRELVDRRVIAPDDVCPICQDELATAPAHSVTYCRFGCGNNLHVKCLKILLEHQTKVMGLDVIRCPLCRKDFGTLDDLKKGFADQSQAMPERLGRRQRVVFHIGVFCKRCKSSPISGRCLRCTVCKDFFICNTCFSSGYHSQHAFAGREDRNSKWILSPRAVGPMFPEALIRDMENRDLTDEDYETLLQLQESGQQHQEGVTGQTFEQSTHTLPRMVNQGSIPLHVINSFPTFQVSARRDEKPAHQCTVCMLPWAVGELARRIPCRHVFHQKCIDRWLLHHRTTCPKCGLAAYCAITMEDQGSVERSTSAASAEEEGRPPDLTSPSYKPAMYARPRRETNAQIAVQNASSLKTPRDYPFDMAIVGSRSSAQVLPSELHQSTDPSPLPSFRSRRAPTNLRATVNGPCTWLDVQGVGANSAQHAQQATVEKSQRSSRRKIDRTASVGSSVSQILRSRRANPESVRKPTISDERRDQRIFDDLLHVTSPWLPLNAGAAFAAETHDIPQRNDPKRGNQLHQMLLNAEARAAAIQNKPG
ncbi:hypothetical protein BJ742DRAFT_869168 [Cladochytrium replicatum]|nr:hypothetical protein BJ742DRAFT_869168 [Cladochytrium replicatum]